MGRLPKNEINFPQEYAIRFQNNKTSSNFELLYNQTKGILYNFAKKFIREQDEINDIVSNVYLTIYDKIDMFNPQYTFVSWCYILIRNECLWSINRSKQNIELSYKDNDSSDSDDILEKRIYWENNVELPTFTFFDDNETIEERENKLLDITFHLIDKSPELWQPFLIDRHFDNLTMEELAIKHNVCENTAKTRLRNGRLWVQKEYEKLTKEKFSYDKIND